MTATASTQRHLGARGWASAPPSLKVPGHSRWSGCLLRKGGVFVVRSREKAPQTRAGSGKERQHTRGREHSCGRHLRLFSTTSFWYRPSWERMETTKRNGCELVRMHRDAWAVDGTGRGLAEKPSSLPPSRPRRGGSGQPVPVPGGKPAWGLLSYLEWGCHSPVSSGLGHSARAEESIQEKTAPSVWGWPCPRLSRASWCPGSAGLPCALCSSEGGTGVPGWGGSPPVHVLCF